MKKSSTGESFDSPVLLTNLLIFAELWDDPASLISNNHHRPLLE
jgi:hypothetical protein